MSLRNLYEISRRSFRVIDSRMNVAGQNVANANSAGYARRRVISSADSNSTLGLQTRSMLNTPTGTGVSISTYDRLRDQLLSAAANRTNGSMEYAGEEHRVLSTVESILDPGDSGINDLLSDFWNAWSDLANNPTEAGMRAAVLSKANNLAGTLNGVSKQLDRYQEDLSLELRSSVDKANSILERLAQLNNVIARSENQNQPNFAAADERDDLVRQLSSLVGVEVQSNHSDGFRIAIGGVFVVEGDHFTPLNLDESTLTIQFGNTGTPFKPETGGSIGAKLSTINDSVNGARARLDQIASALVTEVNAIHATGYVLNGVTGLDFFDPSATSAASIKVSAAIANDVDSIAASGYVDTPGDSSIAAAISELQHKGLIGSRTLGQEVTDMLAEVGSRVKAAEADASGHAAVLANLDAMEAGVSAVSVEDEMTAIIELQQAYAATARVLQSAEEMMNTLLAL